MKSIFLILHLLLTGTLLSGQSLELEVLASFGDWFQGANGMDLHCTMGEPMVERFENDEILTQGFHQVFELATPIFELPDIDIELKIYPNPASDWITIETDAPDELRLQLFDLLGRSHYDELMSNQKETLSIAELPGGNYFLKITDAEQNWVQTFKIQKIK